MRRLACLYFALLAAPLGPALAEDSSALPPNLGGSLRKLAAHEPQEVKAAVRANPRLQEDATGLLVAQVYLDGTVPAATVRKGLEALRVVIIASEPAGHAPGVPHGLFTIHLPLRATAAAAKVPGVRSLALAHRPWRHAGTVTSRGTVTTKDYLVLRRGTTGTGIRVGVISDSFDLTSPHASLDAVRDDLPGAGNRAHRTTPVAVLREANGPYAFSDEGRAMLQIVHDMAPGAALAFAACGESALTMADAVRLLRTDPATPSDIIVDDIGFPDEPFFSTGPLEQAVEDAINSTTLPGRPVLYYSAAGNRGDNGYESDFQPVADADARAGSGGANNLDLTAVPAELTAGGFHNFAGSGAVQIAQKVSLSGDSGEVDFQWNDLFDANRMTSGYSLLVFDASGAYLPELSGIDDPFATGTALQLVNLEEGSYQFAIARRARGTGEAQHFRYVLYSDAVLDGTFLQQRIPTIVGHAGATSADGVAAYLFSQGGRPELFSSQGPVVKYFDSAGARLTTPLVIPQPTLGGPDGVATSLPHFRPFFGTSAAAPHVAGLAALLLQAGGGPGSLTAAQVRQTLQSTSFPHDLDPYEASAALTSTTAGTVTLTGEGDDSNLSSFDAKFFTVSFNAPGGGALKTLSIDLSPAGLCFDQGQVKGKPFTIGGTTGGVSPTVTAALRPGVRGTANSRLILTFADFPAGGTLQFGIDRDLARYHAGGNSADYLAHGIVTATVLPTGATQAAALRGYFVNQAGTGENTAGGSGMVNADAAARALGH